MFCRYCGNSIPDDSQNCTVCGKDLSEQPRYERPKYEQPDYSATPSEPYSEPSEPTAPETQPSFNPVVPPPAAPRNDYFTNASQPAIPPVAPPVSQTSPPPVSPQVPPFTQRPDYKPFTAEYQAPKIDYTPPSAPAYGYNYAVQQPKVTQSEENSSKDGFAIASLVCGIGSVFCCLLGIGGPLLAIIFGVLGMKSTKKGIAIAGLVFGIVSLVGLIIMGIVYSSMIATAINNYGDVSGFENYFPY